MADSASGHLVCGPVDESVWIACVVSEVDLCADVVAANAVLCA